MQNSAIIKRISISFLFVILFSLIGFFLYLILKPAATCSDGKKNQSEKEIDCGGPCTPCGNISKTEDIVIKKSAVVIGGNNTYDAVVKISNPNDSFGASSFKYVFNLKDSNGEIIASREGTSFILPADTKYIAELGFQVEGSAIPVSVEFLVSDEKWEKLNNVGKPQIGVYSKNFGKIPTGEGSSADGVIRNESGYDLGKISLVIVLFSDKGEIIGINKTEKNSVRTKEERDFRLTWPYQLPGLVQSMDVDTQSNVFDPQNFSFSL